MSDARCLDVDACVAPANNKGGDGSDLPSEPCQSHDSALTISSPLACPREASLYRVEVDGGGKGSAGNS